MWILALRTSAAATLTVGGGGDYANVKDAVEAAGPRDRIEVSSGTYTGAFAVTDDLTIVAVDGPGTVTLRGGQVPAGYGVIGVFYGASLTLEGIAFDGQDRLRAVWVEGASLHASDLSMVRPMDGYDNDDGGVIVGIYGSTIVLDDPVLTEPAEGVDDGGYVYVDGGTLEVHGGRFEGGEAWYGDGGAISARDATVLLDGVTFVGNAVAEDGGAVELLYCDVVVTDCVFLDNIAGEYPYDSYDGIGGAGSLLDCDDALLERNVYQGNSARAGGSLFLDDTDRLVLRDEDHYDNTADGVGGAVAVWDASDVLVDRGRFERNVAGDDEGGGIWFHYTAGTEVRGSFFCDNDGRWGGGLDWGESYAFSLHHSIVVGSTSSEEGSALEIYDAEGEIEHVALLGNGPSEVLATWSASVLMHDSLVGWSLDDVYGGYGDVTEHHDAWWENSRGDPPDTTDGVFADPVLGDWGLGRCSGDFRPLLGGPLTDAGSDADADSSPGDIGPYGGQDWDALDIDRDGTPGRTDCDDFDPDVGPCDVPTDSADPTPTDTADPTTPDTADPAGDDDDDDGPGRVQELPPIFFCATGPASPTLPGLLLLPLLLVRRQRRR
ncbi:MAG: right-handed parallel beta-helix repeat-containing protein [Alphaproteobacteria bacterium]|nr:right-handed parallel beta-helix repeat-containing protein [Alphaproteobacteria bacterium]MCB9698837.1 right-handed parallel beta-helix repeat-containing protein [Alphaproteobacteria bacterium]